MYPRIYARIQDEHFSRRRYSFDICRRKLYVNAWRRRTDDGHVKKIAGEREKGKYAGVESCMDDERSLQTCVDVRLYFYPRERKTS